ncbi:MAG: hypothetical protein RIB98_04385 [Acidimicrobiales bacterium]
MPRAHFTIDAARAQPVLILRGELDMHTTSHDLVALRHAAPVAVRMIDARDVTFIDASGISLLLAITGNRPTDIIASTPVRRLIELCGLAPTLRVMSPRRANGRV